MAYSREEIAESFVEHTRYNLTGDSIASELIASGYYMSTRGEGTRKDTDRRDYYKRYNRFRRAAKNPSNNKPVVLTTAQRRAVWHHLANGKSVASLATRFGVSRKTIDRIRSGRTRIK